VGPAGGTCSDARRRRRALALSFDDASLSLVESRTLPSKVTRLPLKRHVRAAHPLARRGVGSRLA